MGAREILQRQVSLELFGPGRATRVFRVDTRDHAEAIEHQSVPAYGSFHPQYPALTLRRKSAAYADDGGTVTDVTCEYESPEFNSTPPVPKDDPAFTSWSVRYESQDVELPVFYRTSVDVNGVTKVAYIYQPVKVIETRVIRSVSLTLTGVSFASQEIIAAQQNRLHTIQGRKYRFISGDLVQRGADLWDVTYSWIDDRGSPRLSFSIPPTPPTDPVYSCWTDRQPHAFFQVIPRADPFDGLLPSLVQVVPYGETPDGHTTLPGASKIDFRG